MPTLNQAQTNAVEHLLRLSPVIDTLGKLFNDAGEELYLVGGSVRDALLGALGNDLDFTTSARPDKIEILLKKFTNITWDMGRKFGTIGAKKEIAGREWVIEITTFRSDAYSPDSRKPDVVFGNNLEQDLIRRDFTINAMAINLINKKFIDPHHGLKDLATGIIRTPDTPEISFSDDPLRMMRAARFASRLNFQVSPDVQQAMNDMAARIKIVSAERISAELSSLLLTNNPRIGLNLLVDTTLAQYVLPELPALKLESDEHLHHKDVYEHSLTVLDRAIALEKKRGHQPDLINRLAALLHDIGKPATRRFEYNKVTFHHHDVVGAKLARKRLRKLHFATSQIDSVCKLIELHLRFHGYGDKQWTDSAVRRYVRDAGDELERLHMLTRSDCTTRNKAKAARLSSIYDSLEKRIAELSEQEELNAIRPDLNGTEIMEILDIPASRIVGQAYKYLLEIRLNEGPQTKQQATKKLLKWWETQNS